MEKGSWRYTHEKSVREPESLPTGGGSTRAHTHAYFFYWGHWETVAWPLGCTLETNSPPSLLKRILLYNLFEYFIGQNE